MDLTSKTETRDREPAAATEERSVRRALPSTAETESSTDTVVRKYLPQ
jgi:hypothetical protein